MSTAEVLGAFQRPVLNQDPTVAAIPGTATLTLVTARAPANGTLIAIVQSGTSVACTLAGGANTDTATGTAVVLSCSVTAGDVVTLRAQANSGPVYTIAGNVTLLVAGAFGLVDLASIFTMLGQLIVGAGAGTASLLNPGTNGQVLESNSAAPLGLDWITLSNTGVTSYNSRTGAVTSQLSDVTGLFTAARQLIVGTGNATGTLLAGGGAGQFLRDSGAALAWALLAAGDVSTAFTALGQLLVGTGNGTGTLLAPGSAGQVLTVAAGTAGWATPAATFSGARVSNSVGQTVATSTPTKLAFDAETIDTGGYHSNVTNNTRITVPVSGYFTVYFAVNYIEVATGNRNFYIYLNNVLYLGVSSPVGAVNSTSLAVLSYDHLLTAGDYLEVVMLQNSGGNISVLGTNSGLGATPVFGVHYLGT